MADILRYTVRPKQETLITIKTSPSAACILYESNPDQHSKFYSDDAGIVRFHVLPPGDDTSTTKFIIECNGRKHELHFRAAHEESPEYPFHVVHQASTTGHRVLPALNMKEALNLPGDELIKRGYMPRPHIDAPSEVSDVWLKSVMTPYTRIEPQIVARPDIGSGYRVRAPLPKSDGVPDEEISTPEATLAESFFNWSGFGLAGPAENYDQIFAAWTVPTVTPSAQLSQHTFSLIWVGIDGDPGRDDPSSDPTPTHTQTDLVQCGTGQDINKFASGWSVPSYYAWTEFLPQQQTLQQVPNFVVNPGDQIFCNLVVGTSGVTPTLTGDGLFFIRNDTTHNITIVPTARGSTNVVGSQAIWIVERPSISQVYQPLANFGSVTISSAMARRVDGALLSYPGGPSDLSVQDTMRNDANTADICTVAAVENQRESMTFTYLGSN